MALIAVEIGDVAAEIRKAGEIATDTAEALRDVAKDLAVYQEERMSAGDFPPPLKPATVRKKLRAGYPETALTMTGALRHNMESVVENGAAVLRPGPGQRWYARILQLGAGSIPPRDLYTVDESRVMEVFSSAMERAAGKASAVFG